MPGIFESLKRMAEGKPVFDANDANNNKPTQQPGAARPPADGAPQGHHGTGVVKGQASTFPVVVVKRTRAQLSGKNQNVYCSIVNHSNLAVEVEEIHLNGASRKIGGYLRPGEEREWLCYSGPRRTSEAYKVATLDYKVEQDGDYFQSIYDVEYQIENDRTYSVEELHFRSPIKDIYG